ncbi:MAG TPA: hypothetical protein VH988_11575 [Thermoanaerobaculia bacterium]|jgi:hypothetical protein|nr:hypothetical protein [Thermoanaerobaculia bacterium]
MKDVKQQLKAERVQDPEAQPALPVLVPDTTLKAERVQEPETAPALPAQPTSPRRRSA